MEGESDEDGSREFEELSKLQLHVPLEGFEVEPSYLYPREIKYLVRQISKIRKAEINAYITTPKDEAPEDEEIENLSAAIFRDHEGVVLRDDIVPDPPVRGPFGYAYIPLKPDAKPCKQKPFTLHGERQEAYKKVVQGWLEKNMLNFLRRKN